MFDLLTCFGPKCNINTANEIRSIAYRVSEEAERYRILLLAWASLDLAHMAEEFGQTVANEVKAKKVWCRFPWLRKKCKGKRRGANMMASWIVCSRILVMVKHQPKVKKSS
jgi:hypothetical protein